jgi:hypothetical protein
MPLGRHAGAALTVEYIEDENLWLQEHELEMKRIILISTGDERAIVVERPVGDLFAGSTMRHVLCIYDGDETDSFC